MCCYMRGIVIMRLIVGELVNINTAQYQKQHAPVNYYCVHTKPVEDSVLKLRFSTKHQVRHVCRLLTDKQRSRHMFALQMLQC